MKRKAIYIFAFIATLAFTGCSKHHDSPPAPVNYTQISYTYTDHTFLSVARSHLAAAAAGNVIVFAGGKTGIYPSDAVDIYNVKTHKWTTAKLSEARYDLAAAAVGNQIFFAGGETNSSSSKTVDIYNVKTNKWTTAQLSVARSGLAAAAAGGKVLFAGGQTGGASNLYKTVDIYDVKTNKWSTTELSVPHNFPSGAGANNKIVFAGGISGLNVIDIYDTKENTWSAKFNVMMEINSSVASGDKIYITNNDYGRVLIYDTHHNTWTQTNYISGLELCCRAAASDGNKVVFAGGGGRKLDYSNTVNIYDTTSDTWITALLSEARGFLAGAAAGNKIVIAGGETASGPSKTVDIFTLSK